MSTALRTYYRGANLVSLREHPTGQTRYYHSDYQGTTQCLTDSAGTVTDRFACDALLIDVPVSSARVAALAGLEGLADARFTPAAITFQRRLS